MRDAKRNGFSNYRVMITAASLIRDGLDATSENVQRATIAVAEVENLSDVSFGTFVRRVAREMRAQQQEALDVARVLGR